MWVEEEEEEEEGGRAEEVGWEETAAYPPLRCRWEVGKEKAEEEDEEEEEEDVAPSTARPATRPCEMDRWVGGLSM